MGILETIAPRIHYCKLDGMKALSLFTSSVKLITVESLPRGLVCGNRTWAT